MTADMTEVGRLRAILIQAHDALTVALQSLDRAIAAVEGAHPALGSNGRTERGHPDDDAVRELQLYDDLAAGAPVVAAPQPGSLGGEP